MKSLTYPVCVELRLISTAAHGTPGFAVAAFDVSHWREREASLAHALHHDPLTGLENLIALKEAIGAAQDEAELTRTHAGLVLLDIDDYQRINRALGYNAAGDELLRETARRIQHTAGLRSPRQGDRASRAQSAKARQFVLVPARPVRSESGTISASFFRVGSRVLGAATVTVQ